MEPSSVVLFSLALGFLGGFAIALVAALGNVRVVRAAAYAYTTARLRVIRGIALSPRRWEELLRAGSLQDMAPALDGTIYGPALMPVLARGDVDGADHTLDRELARLEVRALDLVPVKDRQFGRLLGLRLDIASIRRVIRGIHAGRTADELENIHPAPTWGRRDAHYYELMARASTVEEAVIRLSHELDISLDAALDSYKENGNLHALELALDAVWFDAMDHAILPGADMALVTIVEEMADVENLKMALRAANRGAEPPASLPGGGLSADVLEKAARADSLDVFAAALEGSIYGPMLVEALSSGTGAPGMEAALDRHILALARTTFQGSPFGLEAILAFMLEREYEARNLRAVIRGKAANMDQSTIKELMVVV